MVTIVPWAVLASADGLLHATQERSPTSTAVGVASVDPHEHMRNELRLAKRRLEYSEFARARKHFDNLIANVEQSISDGGAGPGEIVREALACVQERDISLDDWQLLERRLISLALDVGGPAGRLPLPDEVILKLRRGKLCHRLGLVVDAIDSNEREELLRSAVEDLRYGLAGLIQLGRATSTEAADAAVELAFSRSSLGTPAEGRDGLIRFAMHALPHQRSSDDAFRRRLAIGLRELVGSEESRWSPDAVELMCRLVLPGNGVQPLSSHELQAATIEALLAIDRWDRAKQEVERLLEESRSRVASARGPVTRSSATLMLEDRVGTYAAIAEKAGDWDYACVLWWEFDRCLRRSSEAATSNRRVDAVLRRIRAERHSGKLLSALRLASELYDDLTPQSGALSARSAHPSRVTVEVSLAELEYELGYIESARDRCLSLVPILRSPKTGRPELAARCHLILGWDAAHRAAWTDARDHAQATLRLAGKAEEAGVDASLRARAWLIELRAADALDGSAGLNRSLKGASSELPWMSPAFELERARLVARRSPASATELLAGERDWVALAPSDYLAERCEFQEWMLRFDLALSQNEVEDARHALEGLHRSVEVRSVRLRDLGAASYRDARDLAHDVDATLVRSIRLHTLQPATSDPALITLIELQRLLSVGEVGVISRLLSAPGARNRLRQLDEQREQLTPEGLAEYSDLAELRDRRQDIDEAREVVARHQGRVEVLDFGADLLERLARGGSQEVLYLVDLVGASGSLDAGKGSTAYVHIRSRGVAEVGFLDLVAAPQSWDPAEARRSSAFAPARTRAPRSEQLHALDAVVADILLQAWGGEGPPDHLALIPSPATNTLDPHELQSKLGRAVAVKLTHSALFAPPTAQGPARGEVLLIGNPDPGALCQPAPPEAQATRLPPRYGLEAAEAAAQSLDFSSVELESIDETLLRSKAKPPMRLESSELGLEQVLRSLPGASILHLALSSSFGSDVDDGVGVERGPFASAYRPVLHRAPGEYAAFVLSGSQWASADEKIGDALLFASDLIDESLAGAELVVLSTSGAATGGTPARAQAALLFGLQAIGVDGVIYGAGPIDDELASAALPALYESNEQGRPEPARRFLELRAEEPEVYRNWRLARTLETR